MLRFYHHPAAICIIMLLATVSVACKRLPEKGTRPICRLAYHFEAPAAQWEESLPLGNGRIGLMPDGGVDRENVLMNEISMWSGSRQNADNPTAFESLKTIRDLLFQGRNDEAQQLMYEQFVCGGDGSGHGHGYEKPYGSYQQLGYLRIDYRYGNNATDTTHDYRRELDLKEAVASVSFRRGNTVYRREAFTSFADDIAVIRLTADRDNAINFILGMDRDERYHTTPDGSQLVMTGRLYEGDPYTPRRDLADDTATVAPPRIVKEGKGVRYGARVRIVLPKGGTVALTADSLLQVRNAGEAILLVSMATDYFGHMPDSLNSALLAAAANKSYDQLRAEHVDAYRELFGRVELDLGCDLARDTMPIDRRLAAFAADRNDAALMTLYYQFGRYLLISATRPQSLPPNLQGLWCRTIDTPWNGDYHLNINLQMNHWPAEAGNLPELHRPLIEWTKQQVESGRRTAQVYYNARGWVTHILGNVWQFTAPGEHPSWGATNTSAAWLCAHLYDHYLYDPDSQYLAEVYPVMKEAALFFVDMLVKDPRTGKLVTAPTTSPENAYLMPNGSRVSVCAGSTMDNQIVRQLFANTIAAARTLGIDTTFAQLLAEKSALLMPTTIGADGRIMEWLEEYPEAEPGHRHVSHLYGLYPGDEINVYDTPELADAARRTLLARGDISTGWSMAWKICFWARLHDGEQAYKLLADLLRPVVATDVNMTNGGGTYPNLFCSHPPFQIDGNFGGCAGIGEMLVQSAGGVIDILPALPAAWPHGSVSGMRVQGGGTVAISWSKGRLDRFELKAGRNHCHRIRLAEGMTDYMRVRINGVKKSFPVFNGAMAVQMAAGDILEIDYKLRI